jgi:glucose/arabinose dehydrogenase
MRICTLLLLGNLGFACCAADKPPQLPAPYHTPSANNRPTIVPRPDGVQLRLPSGFTADEYASGFEQPRYMALTPAGQVLLADSVKKGSVYVLLDKDGDHKAEDRRKLIADLDRPFGLAFWKDYLYVAEQTSVKRYKYDATALALGPGEEVVAMKDFTQGHWTRTILFDRKGEKFYLAVGSHHDAATGGPEMRAAISRYNPDGSGAEVIATGLRNPIGLAWTAKGDALWAAVQERDFIGDDLVPDYFTQVRAGAFYGWPYAYSGPNEDPRFKGQRTDLVQKTVVPDVFLPSHAAVMDARFYTGKQFPKKYQGGAFLAFHGSSNRTQRVGYSVAFVPFKAGKPSGPVEEFLTGFMLGPDKKEVWGRPVGLLVMPDGSLLVSEDGNKRVWRISYKK